ncbi:rhamnogalacturonan acetylesterase [Aridibaculum aurantiacum]|uniref:rhamnogalacturonan acetylesterase n=1 Tax=Aridibaculum aurantiacum TaxID=2810307 RepID=UPI001A96AFD1|nr:rhamnogalacturonan acetylesterase [Aridibaculum aurantiacum]
MKKPKTFLLSASILAIMAFTAPVKKTTVWLVGDSTIAIKETRRYPETGWGMPFVHFFDSTVQIENRAKNGRSTRTFISEKLWQPVSEGMKEGDYLFIQFGHNDESKEKTDRYTTPEDYKANITRFVNEARQKKAQPVLITPVSRRKFKDGKQVPTHEVYSQLVKELAAELKVPLIDLDAKSQALYQKLGEEPSKLLFLQLAANEHPNYPEGKNDNTHFSELGARLVAQLVLQEIKALNLDLANKVVKPVKK